jgi:nucleoside-diphosphate-sugar epimerase
MDQRVLITGATGFLGQEVARRLVARAGVHLRALVRSDDAAQPLADLGVEIHPGDLRETTSLAGAARGIDLVIHLAAVHRGGNLRRTDFWQVNSEGTKRLLQEAVRAGVRRFVYVSTAGVLGNVRPNRLGTEADAAKPRDLYEVTKWRGEQAVRRIAHSDGLEAVIVRPAAVYGPGERRFLKLFRPIARRRFVVIGSGEHRLHFIHVADAAEGILAAAMSPDARGETFLLADSSPIRIGDLVRLVASALGVPPPSLRIPYAPVYALALACEGLCRPFGLAPPLYRRRLAFFGTERAYSTRKLAEVTGFRARTELATGIPELAAWYRAEKLL